MDYSVALITAIFYKNKTTKIKILILLFVYFGNDIEYLSATNGFSFLFSFFSKTGLTVTLF
jgi:hypothetical protein